MPEGLDHARREPSHPARRPLRRAELVIAALGVLAFALLVVELEVEGRGGFWWERRLANVLAAHWDDSLVRQARHVSREVGDWAGLLALAIAVAIVGLGMRSRRAVVVVAFSPAMVLLTPLLKDALMRPSPLHAHAAGPYSFPSGHGIGTMAVAAGVTSVLWHTRWRWAAIGAGALLVLSVGAAVVADRGHWPSDVVAGWAIAVAWVAILRAGVGRIGHCSAPAGRGETPSCPPGTPRPPKT